MRREYRTGARKINYLVEYDILRKNNNDYSLSYNTDEILSELYSLVSPEDIFKSLNAYPDPEYGCMNELIQKRYHIKNILFGSGSEELIFRINKGLLKDKKTAVVVPVFYRVTETLDHSSVCLNICDYMTEGEFRKEEFIGVLEEKQIDAVWIANPNSIYGIAVPKEDLMYVIEKCSQILFIIDEVSIDFLEQPEKYELLQEAEKKDNLIVIKSMSKYYGVPGLRLGMLSANDAYTGRLRGETCVYPVSNLTCLYIKTMLENDEKFVLMKNKIRRNAQRLKQLLEGTPINMMEPMTNTVFLWWDSKKDLWELLAKYRIISFSLKEEEHVRQKNSVRLTIHSGDKFEYLYEQVAKLKKMEFHEEKIVYYGFGRNFIEQGGEPRAQSGSEAEQIIR